MLSTCNRTEVYAVVERFHGAYQDIRDFLCDLAGAAPEELADHLYSHFDDDAVAHLFAVAAGLDSAVLGESRDPRPGPQLRGCWRRQEGAARSGLNLLFRHALEVGKRVRTETAIGRSTASVSSAAVEMATERLGGLAGRRVLVVGAGDMGEGMAVALRAAGAGEMVVANRTIARAVELAGRVGGGPPALGRGRGGSGRRRRAAHLHRARARCCSSADAIAEAMAAGPGGRCWSSTSPCHATSTTPSPSFPGVTLLDLDDLRAFAERGLAERRAEAARRRAIVAEEVERYAEDRQRPPGGAARRRGSTSGPRRLRQAELERYRRRLGEPRRARAGHRGGHHPRPSWPSCSTSRRCASRTRPARHAGERYAEVLRDLFDLS